MTKPTVPPALRRRNADNLKRRLDPDPDPVMIGTLSRAARYGGSSKHKRNPVRPVEPIAELVHRRFAVWAGQHGEDQDRAAERRCRDLYGFAS